MKKFLEDLQSLDTNDVGRWPFLFRARRVCSARRRGSVTSCRPT